MKIEYIGKVIELEPDDIIRFLENFIFDDPEYHLDGYIDEEETPERITYQEGKYLIQLGKR